MYRYFRTRNFFLANTGEYKDRFSIVFKNDLANNTIVETTDVLLYASSNALNLKASKEIVEVFVFDVLGRKIATLQNSNEKEVSLNLSANNNALIVKVILNTGEVITKKIMK